MVLLIGDSTGPAARLRVHEGTLQDRVVPTTVKAADDW